MINACRNAEQVPDINKVATSSPPQKKTSLTLWDVVRLLVGGLLLLSASLKLHQLLSLTAIGSKDWLSSLAVQWIAIGWEFVLALWLWLGYRPIFSRWATFATFAVFAAVSLRQVANGEPTCGCFGQFVVSPWIVFSMDVMIVALISQTKTSDKNSLHKCHCPRIAIGGAIISIAAVAAVIVNSSIVKPIALADDVMPASGSTVAVHPEQWLGKKFPLVNYIESNESLGSGRWLVLFQRQNCEACVHAIPEVLTYAYEHQDDADRLQLAIVEVPAAISQERPAMTSTRLCSRGRLEPSRLWQMPSPMLCAIRDGVLEKVATNLNDLWTAESIPTNATVAGWGTPHGFPDYRLLHRRMQRQEFACGPLALIRILGHLGLPPTASETERLIAAAGTRGTDLLQLKRLAEDHGLHGVGVLASVARLRKLELPAIIHLNHVAFAAVLRYEPDGLVVANSEGPPMVVPDEQLTQSFGQQGRALLLAREPIQIGNLASHSVGEIHKTLRPERTCITVGQIHNQSWRAEMVLWNDAPFPIRVREVMAIRDPLKACCNTTVEATLSVMEIPAKGSALLTVKGQHNVLGAFTHSVRIVSQSKTSAPLVLAVRGFVTPGVFPERPAYQFPETPVLAKSSIDVPLEMVASGKVASDVIVEIPNGAPLRGTVVDTSDGPTLRLTWLGADMPGWNRFTLTIRDDPSQDRAVTPLIVAVPVVPNIDVFPPSLSISNEELANGWSRRITITSRVPLVDMLSTWSDDGTAELIDVVSRSDGDTKNIVLIRSKKSSSKSDWMGGTDAVLTLFWKDGSTSRVPIRFGERHQRPRLERQESAPAERTIRR